MIKEFQPKLNLPELFEGKQNQLNKIFEENDVVLAYLFGSAARGSFGPLSDVDVAVLCSEKVGQDDYFDKRLKLASEIDKILGIYKTEVICLNQVPPFLRHRAVFHGMPIFVGDVKLKRSFELRVLQEYEDFKYHLESAHRIMTSQIKDGTFGKPIISPRHSKILEKYVKNR